MNTVRNIKIRIYKKMTESYPIRSSFFYLSAVLLLSMAVL